MVSVTDCFCCCFVLFWGVFFFFSVENLILPRSFSKMENFISVIMGKMHICFRQQWCSKISSKVPTHNFWGRRGLSKVLCEAKKSLRAALNTCSSLDLDCIFYLASQNPAFRESQFSKLCLLRKYDLSAPGSRAKRYAPSCSKAPQGPGAGLPL